MKQNTQQMMPPIVAAENKPRDCVKQHGNGNVISHIMICKERNEVKGFYVFIAEQHFGVVPTDMREK